MADLETLINWIWFVGYGAGPSMENHVREMFRKNTLWVVLDDLRKLLRIHRGVSRKKNLAQVYNYYDKHRDWLRELMDDDYLYSGLHGVIWNMAFSINGFANAKIAEMTRANRNGLSREELTLSQQG